ncbi:unnamed protein product, partial [Effrenium voratum]
QVNPAKRAINAIRVFLNRELQQLEEGLGAAMRLLKVGGRCAVLTFSPLERRVVHEFLRNHEEPPPEDVANLSPGRLAELFPLAGTDLPFSVQRLTAQRAPRGAEYAASPRSRSSALLLLKKCPRCAAAAAYLDVEPLEDRLVLFSSQWLEHEARQRGIRLELLEAVG